MGSKIASFKVSDMKPIPIPPPPVEIIADDLPSLFSRLVQNDIRSKPSYTDSWVLAPPADARILAAYRTPYCGVSICDPGDGELEYDVLPLEYAYPDALNSVVAGTIEKIRKEHLDTGGRLDRDSVTGNARKLLLESFSEISDACGPDSDLGGVLNDLSSVVYRHSVGAGVFEILLTDPHIEDVFLDAPCESNRIYVTVNGIEGFNSHMRCRTNVMVEKREVSNLINMLKRSSGLRFAHSNPILETDFPDLDARATVIGPPMSPKGEAVAIRKHSERMWTLSRLIFNGTVDPRSAGILSFLVDNRCTFLICGPRGAGKSSLLSALMFEFPKEQRILTIEDTIELPGESMRRMGYKVQTMLVDDRLGGDQQSRSDEALRVSLRMGESAIILGEVRGEEARTLYQSMRAGRAGSSIMGTIHGDSAESAYKRVVEDLGVSPDSFMATDVVVTLGTVKDRRTGRLIRRMNEMVCTSDVPGEFKDITDIDRLFESSVMARAMRSSQLGRKEISKDIRARSLMRSLLAAAGRDDERFLGPEWILRANDILSRSDMNQSAESIAQKLQDEIDSVRI